MNRNHEKLLVATLCGLIIVGTAAFAVQPAMAAGYDVDTLGKVYNVQDWDHLNVRKWPAARSQKIGSFSSDAHFWIERCIEVPKSADWCLVDGGGTRGWVNSKFLATVSGTDI
ncbi:hypothetical protein [Devosia sp.]|uniref:SH3 domain-containing protein n=1 Tax=Devosia sp. TaxID=1871048 RepID=UPI003265B413